ncbi:MAG: ATP-binding protein [Oscillospiraceae bacterium]|nr:HAMP domain-containing protein [Oscillospiraceae bacterium]MCD8255073.1 ATP-binding protein [Oscillospiraceae bacterium]
MAVTGAFLLRGVQSFFLSQFYDRMSDVFSDAELAEDIANAASSEDAGQQIADILRAYSGQLGIDSGTRNYYVLDGETAAVLSRSGTDETSYVSLTPNLLTALSGSEGFESNSQADYMDVALPVSGESGSFIIYIIDSKETVREQSDALFRIIMESLAVGLAISVLLTLLLARTLITPIRSLTTAAEKVAAGDFSKIPDNPARDEIGTLSRTFNDMADQLERSIDEMRRSENMRREFVANVSHELRTPVTSIKSYAETLEDAEGAMDPETEQHFLEVIVRESDRMTKIVQDLLTLSRFDAGSIDFDFQEFSFEKSVQDVYAAQLIEAQRHGHEFTLSFKTPVPKICGDRQRIEQVMINMISNAIKYTRSGGRIRLTAGCENNEVWFTVRDNGIGIPEEDVPHIFERFYRVDKARSRESGGTGLGLSIAHEIVERHNGRIDVKSRSGHGTTMTVTLPVEGPVNGQDN